MQEELQNHIQKLVSLDAQQCADIITYFTPIEASKKYGLLQEGTICRHNYFVSKGCLRLFYINEKGVEQTIQFALENWWLSDYTSFSSQQPAQFCIQAVERSEILALDMDSQEKMLQRFPVMERYFRLVHQRAHAASQFRIRNLYSASREELYRQFVGLYPEFVQRIPQYLLASFLGFTPEYLSEIRRKKIS